MLSLPDRASILSALDLPLEPQLHELLAAHVRTMLEDPSLGLIDMTHILVVERGDSVEAIKGEVGFSPLVCPYDGARFGSLGFHPFWDWLKGHGRWFEMIVTVGNSGFAYILLIGADHPDLLTLCRAFAAHD